MQLSTNIILEAREKVRHEYLVSSALTDPSAQKERHDFALQVIEFLRKNIAQAKLSRVENDVESKLVYTYKITKDHEMTDNSPSAEEPAKSIGSAQFTSISATAKLQPLGPCRLRCEDCSCGAPPAP